MSRSGRLLELLQILRTKSRAARAVDLAGELGVSLRTLYRDIGVLQGEGVPIEGEAGVGYVLRPGYLMPPLMLSLEELEAVRLGLDWVLARDVSHLQGPATDALAKVWAVLPPQLRQEAQSPMRSLVSLKGLGPRKALLDECSLAIQRGKKLRLRYQDAGGVETERVVWPFLVGYFDQREAVAAWCEMRNDFRHFRTDRMVSALLLDEPTGRSRQELLRQWQVKFSLDDDQL